MTTFNSKKVFYKHVKTIRFRLTYDGKALFCSVCLAFGNEINSFVMGMSTWSHMHQRIIEHEQNYVHTYSTEAFVFNHKENSIDYLLFKNQKQVKYERVKKKRQKRA